MIGKLIRSTIRTLVAAAFVVGLASAGSPAGAQTALKKLKFGLGTPVMNLTYPWASMPVALGYWSQAGYDVEVFAAQSSLQSIQQLNAGNLDFAEVNSAPIVQAIAGNN